MSSNPYAAPRAAVSDVEVEPEYQEIEMWSSNGRIGRLRYLAYCTGAALAAGAAAGLLAAVLGAVGAILAVFIYIAATLFSIIAGIKRSHDMDWNGWTVLLTFIPAVGLIWVFVSGTKGSNSYGPPPPPNTTGVKILALMLPIIAVIGILAAIAIPAYVKSQQGTVDTEYEQTEYEQSPSSP